MHCKYIYKDIDIVINCHTFNFKLSLCLFLLSGNWDTTDFASGMSFPPEKSHKANRDMLVVMQSPDIVQHFMKVFQHDFDEGNPWDE